MAVRRINLEKATGRAPQIAVRAKGEFSNPASSVVIVRLTDADVVRGDRDVVRWQVGPHELAIGV
jgi:hypothetical protein